LGGALLDVWWQYPTPDEPNPRPSKLPFHELPASTVITPHDSAWSHEMLDRRWDTIAANIDAALMGGLQGLDCVLKQPE
jgi:phosphoglycerate dehydrogenase-like enzyme